MRLFTVCSLTWIGGLVAGLLIRSASGHHGIVAAIVVVSINAGIAGAVFKMWRRWHDARPVGRSEQHLLLPFLTPAARARVDAETSAREEGSVDR